jgi:hypothetical protein
MDNGGLMENGRGKMDDGGFCYLLYILPNPIALLKLSIF